MQSCNSWTYCSSRTGLQRH
nr:hypothetical protein [Escherichia coli]